MGIGGYWSRSAESLLDSVANDFLYNALSMTRCVDLTQCEHVPRRDTLTGHDERLMNPGLQQRETRFHRTRRCLMITATVALSLSCCLAGKAQEPSLIDPAETAPDDGPVYQIDRFVLQYVRDNPRLPDMAQMKDEAFLLGKLETGFVAPRTDLPVITTSINKLNAGDESSFHLSGLQHVLVSLRDELVERELMGVFVAPDPTQITPQGQDLRSNDRELRLIITVGVVSDVRTLASGDRIPEEERINHPLHERIRRDSPIAPDDGEGVSNSLLRRDALDRYIYHLSRHPGRRIDVAIAPAEESGTISLDYKVSENRPLVLYGQISNTGTEQTDRLRERFGLFHTQVSNRDDILSLEYITTNFDETHAVLASYEFPWPANDRVRVRIAGDWSEYTASEVGFFNDRFRGETWGAGADVFANIYQDANFFVDAFAGFRYADIEVDNQAVFVEGEEEFFVPHVGVRFDHTSDWYSTVGSAFIEWNLGDVTGQDRSELNRLGRLFPDKDWAALKWDLSHSFYLEPAINPEEWADPSTPESSTLAHELAFSFRGQYAFDHRFPPQYEGVAGGLYTVRGYPESIVAGDTVFIASAEYRYHVPREFEVQPEPRELFGEPFRTAPQHVYGRPDWDLILRAFVDIGRTINSDRLSFERNETLIGAGIGAELQLKRNLNLRVDWGFTLEELESADVDDGANRLHFVATILF